MRNEKLKRARGRVKEGGMEGLLNAALCFVQCFDPLSTFPRAGQHTQEVSKQRNVMKA